MLPAIEVESVKVTPAENASPHQEHEENPPRCRRIQAGNQHQGESPQVLI